MASAKRTLSSPGSEHCLPHVPSPPMATFRSFRVLLRLECGPHVRRSRPGADSTLHHGIPGDAGQNVGDRPTALPGFSLQSFAI